MYEFPSVFMVFQSVKNKTLVPCKVVLRKLPRVCKILVLLLYPHFHFDLTTLHPYNSPSLFILIYPLPNPHIPKTTNPKTLIAFPNPNQISSNPNGCPKNLSTVP